MGHFSGTETYWDGYSAWPFFIPKEPHQSQQRTRKVAYFFTLKRTKTGRRNGLLPKPNWTTYIRSDTVSPWVPVYNATPHSGINYYPPQAVLDGTWTKLQRKREEGMRNALSEVTITQLPDTKAGTGLPAEVSIIRTTTQTAPTPQPITI